MQNKFYKKFPFLLIVIILSSSSLILNSCHCSCGAADAADVPLSVLKKANEFIIARTGKTFFNKYIEPDFVKTKYYKPDYKIAYRLFMPEKPYVNVLIEFTIDAEGNVDTTKDVIGIPNCANDSNACSFNIDEKKAEQIAKDNGLTAGVAKWKTGFLWDKELNQYVWHVLSTFDESGKGKEYKGDGKEIVIDPGTGLVLKAYNWRIP